MTRDLDNIGQDGSGRLHRVRTYGNHSFPMPWAPIYRSSRARLATTMTARPARASCAAGPARR
jgi:hypothetical protein